MSPIDVPANQSFDSFDAADDDTFINPEEYRLFGN